MELEGQVSRCQRQSRKQKINDDSTQFNLPHDGISARYRKVLLSRMTKKDAEVLSLTFSNGSTLTGTFNHPVFVKGKGVIPLDAVSHGDIIYCESEVDLECQENKLSQQTAYCSTVLNLDAIQILKGLEIGVITEQAGAIENREYLIYTEKFGNFITAKFLKDTTCITLTEIFLTTIFLIWNYSKEQVICPRICLRELVMRNGGNVIRSIWTKLEGKPLNGISLPKGENGTSSMELK